MQYSISETINYEQREIISQIAPNAIDENGNLKSFSRQMKEYEDTSYNRNSRLVVMKDIDGLQWTGIEDKVVTITEKAVNKILALKHSDPHLHNFLKGLPYEMKKRSVIAFDGYGNNIGKKAIIIDPRSGALSNVLVAVEDRGLNYGNIEINDIATVHERRDIRSTLNKASVFYLNEKALNG